MIAGISTVLLRGWFHHLQMTACHRSWVSLDDLAAARHEREREELTRIFASWNQIDRWLRHVVALRRVA